MAMTALPRSLQQARKKADHDDRRLILSTPEETLVYINRVGFCLLFPSKSLSLPNLWSLGSGTDIWSWKDELSARKAVFYSRVIAGRASLVSLDILPAFYSISPTADHGGDRFDLFRAGRISADTNRLVGVLNAKGPLTTRCLMREMGMAGYRFKRTLFEAQAMFLAVRSDTVLEGFGTYTYVWDGFQKVWPEIREAGLALRYEEALLKVITCYLRLVIADDPDTISTIFGIESEHCHGIVDWMISEDLLQQVPADGRVMVCLSELFPLVFG